MDHADEQELNFQDLCLFRSVRVLQHKLTSAATPLDDERCAFLDSFLRNLQNCLRTAEQLLNQPFIPCTSSRPDFHLETSSETTSSSKLKNTGNFSQFRQTVLGNFSCRNLLITIAQAFVSCKDFCNNLRLHYLHILQLIKQRQQQEVHLISSASYFVESSDAVRQIIAIEEVIAAVTYCIKCINENDEIGFIYESLHGSSQVPLKDLWSTQNCPCSTADSSSPVDMNMLPVEVWRKILGYLGEGDAYLYAVMNASENLTDLLPLEAKKIVADPGFWRAALKKRCVDVEGVGGEDDREDGWLQRYHDYVQSLSCFNCWARILPVQRERFSKRILVEMAQLTLGISPTNYTVAGDGIYNKILLRNNIHAQFCDWQLGLPENYQKLSDAVITLLGPPETPYLGGRFQLHIHFPENFPFEPPVARLLTKIFSPYFTQHGDFYFVRDFLKPFDHETKQNVETTASGEATHGWSDGWSTLLGIGFIVDLVQKYLALSPDLCADGGKLLEKHVVNKDVFSLFLNNRNEFDRIARRTTEKFAMLTLLR